MMKSVMGPGMLVSDPSMSDVDAVKVLAHLLEGTKGASVGMDGCGLVELLESCEVCGDLFAVILDQVVAL